VTTPGLDPAYHAWLREQEDVGAPVIPAATVVLLRDEPAPGGGPPQLEVLMLRRNAAVEFAGGMWVFPGGRVDPEDHPHDQPDLLQAARNASVREAHEEAGQFVDQTSLVWFAHWTPPALAKRRFATFFFACRATGSDVIIDGSEIHDHEWMRPQDALIRQRAHEVDLAPPTWITLYYLAQAGRVDDALARFRAGEPRFYETKLVRDEHGMTFLWRPDAAYDSGALAIPGPRHRIVVTAEGWVLDDSGWPFPA
jgi:8-oxo-dGTP pyrophosphatase MutT (NUDIX family)